MHNVILRFLETKFQSQQDMPPIQENESRHTVRTGLSGCRSNISWSLRSASWNEPSFRNFFFLPSICTRRTVPEYIHTHTHTLLASQPPDNYKIRAVSLCGSFIWRVFWIFSPAISLYQRLCNITCVVNQPDNMCSVTALYSLNRTYIL